MMRLTKRSVWMAIATGALVLSSCADEKDYYDENYKKELYKSQWAKNIGEIDPNQDWNLAMRVTAEVDLSHVAAGDYQVSIYTLNPTNENAKLLARKTVNGTSSIGFDCIKGMNTVFVQVVGEQGAVVNGYVEINNGKVAISRAASRAEGEDECPVTLGEKFTVKANSYKDENDQPLNDEATFIKLDNVVTTTRGNEWQIGDYKGILGEGGVFQEQENNRVKWADDLTHDVYYEMVSDDEVTLDLNYRCTANKENQIGYFFFTGDTPTLEQMQNIDKYVLIPNVTGENDLVIYKEPKQIGWSPDVFEGYGEAKNLTGSTAPIVMTYCKNETVLQGTQFKLVYFDKDGKATYTIPKGTKVGFFLIRNNGNDPANNAIFYSISSLNEHTELKNVVSAVTYQYGGTTFLGFEDFPTSSGDHDLNDIMFFATGDFKKPTDITPGNDDDDDDSNGMTWTIACEDLGNTDDFDFNDIVFGIQYVSGTTVATVYPLAAGGTLPAYLYFNDSELGEVHSFWNKTATNGLYPMINTDEWGIIGMTKTINVSPEFSIADNMGGFKIVVKDGKNAVELKAPIAGDTPQMICMPGTWSWPTERTNIVKAYPDFGEWGANYKPDSEWYNNPAGSIIQMKW